MADLKGRYAPTETLSRHKPDYDEGNPRASFFDEMQGYGFLVKGMAEVGSIVRVAHNSDTKGKQSGWYVYNEFEDTYRKGGMIGVGVFGSWKGDPERIVWSSKRKESMSPAEVSALSEQIERAKAEREAEKLRMQLEAQERAKNIWTEAKDAEDHPYLATKGIKAHSLKESRGGLVVPIYNAGGMLVSLQFIHTDRKRFLSGGEKKGCFSTVGEDSGESIYIAEGWATAATIHEATKSLCYVAFDAGNLMDVAGVVKAKHQDKNIVICGDDDVWTVGNPGRSKAVMAAEINKCEVAFPQFKDTETKPTDFNDMAALHGLASVRQLLKNEPIAYKATDYKQMPQELLSPPGILGDIVAYYNATARTPQPGLAVQTALAIAAHICGRYFRTTKGNHTSLYFLNVAKSGTGKEHSKTVVEEILDAIGQDGTVNGGGYTSSGGFLSRLLCDPRHITIIDEFGRYMEAASADKNTAYKEANTQLMEAIGRLHGIMRPMSYSTMTLDKKKADELNNRKIYNPAVTMIAMTTPSTLFENLHSNSVADGFLGRFIIHQSDVPRQVRDDKDMIDVPMVISHWASDIRDRAGMEHQSEDALIPPVFVTIPFTIQAQSLLREFDQYCVDMCNKLEQFHLEALPGRSKEMAMRMSLIVALAKNPRAESVGENDAEWSINYVKYALEQTTSTLKMRISGSTYEADKKEILAALREAGDWVYSSEMAKRPPYSRHKHRDRKDILDDLIETDLIVSETVSDGKRGRPKVRYMAV